MKTRAEPLRGTIGPCSSQRSSCVVSRTRRGVCSRPWPLRAMRRAASPALRLSPKSRHPPLFPVSAQIPSRSRTRWVRHGRPVG
jgi:hypothetical protein